MAINKDLKERAQKTREDGVFTLKLDKGVSLAMLVSFAQDMFPGVSTKDFGVWPADDGELVVSVRGGGTVTSNWKGLVVSGSPFHTASSTRSGVRSTMTKWPRQRWPAGELIRYSRARVAPQRQLHATGQSGTGGVGPESFALPFIA